MNAKLEAAVYVGVGSVALLALWSALFLDRGRLRALVRHPWSRLRPHLTPLGMLGVVLIVNSFARDIGPEVSWAIGWNISGAIYSIEGNVVATVQAVDVPYLTPVLSFVYLSGYVALLVFPFVAYLALEDRRPVREAALAYGITYTVGLACYVLFVSYGPRNLIPDLVDPRLYAAYPSTQLLTGEVNSNTNVFPSLHTALSVAVAGLAWRTRASYPGWTVASAVMATCVAFATMYLGIHWATDVVAGALLGVSSVWVAARVVDPSTESEHDAESTEACSN